MTRPRHSANTATRTQSSENSSRSLGFSGAHIILGSRFRIPLFLWVFGYLGVWVLPVGISTSLAATFEQQRAVISRSAVTQSESAIITFLQTGIEVGRPTEAIAETRKWLRQNLPEDPMLLYHAARAAELSGDIKGAVALYQQYLEGADLKSETADEAVFAVYTLLLDRLHDTAGAYSFSKTKGDRLLVCPRARQFDEWYLDQAVHQHRSDLLAVANRLRACIEAGLPEDLLIARYDNYFRWLLGRVGGSSGFRRDAQVSREMLDACKKLASAMTFFEELKLRLDWAVSVRFYVQQRLAEKDVAPPIEEAKALLAKYPKYAIDVQLGWAGGTRDNHPNHTGDTKFFWSHELDAKMAPVVEAAPKLSPVDRADLLGSWRQSGYWREPHRLNLHKVKAVKDYLDANPKLTNSRSGVLIWDKPWDRYSPEEALQLAPQIDQNPDRNASYLRAFAAGIVKKEVKDGEKTKTEYTYDFDKVMAALLGPEAWRLGTRIDMHHAGGYQLHKMCGSPGGKQKQEEFGKKMEAVAAKITAETVNEEAPANQRLAAFRKLWNDYRSPQPKMPAVYERSVGVLKFTPEALPELLRDPSPEAQSLARAVIGDHRGMSGPDPMWKELDWRKDLKTTHYDPIMMAYVHHHRGIDEIKKRYPNKCKPHPLESVLRQAVAEGLKKNEVESWLVIAWINTQWPEDNEEQVKVMQALLKSPAWDTLSFEAQFCAREWFKRDAMTAGQVAWVEAGRADKVCKGLRELAKEADVGTTVAALEAAIAGLKESPVKMQIEGLDKLAEVSEEVFEDPKVVERLLEITDGLRYVSNSESQPFAKRLYAYVKKEREPVLVHRTAACLWAYGASGSRGHQYEPTKNLTGSLLDEHPSAAHAMARHAVETLSRARNIYGYNPSQRVPEMRAILGKSAMEVGLMVIPVARTSPAYPIYKSQGEWMLGNEDTAWSMLNENWEELLPNHRNLDLDYLAWVLQRVIYLRDETRQEELVKALLAWAGEDGTPYSKTQRVELELAYGDIAVQRGMLKEAHQIYTRTRNNKAYNGLVIQHQATLRRVRVERIGKDFDAALKTLNDLEIEHIPEIWDDIHYARAEVYFDMEEYEDAADELNAILTRDPDHADAKVMLGKVNIKRQKLIDAIELDVVPGTDQETLVPGEKLKVTLNDPTLAVSGAGTEIEVAVYTKTGDREQFFLRQFGDNKTKFRGEILVELGAPNPGDRILQVIGDDEVFYGYTERFRKKMDMKEDRVSGPITIASNGLLMASARKLLTEAEQRVADMEAKMLKLTRGRAVTRGAAGGAMAMTAAEIEKKLRAGEEVVDEVLEPPVETRVKPGNPIHVRVIDPDRSRTADIDDVVVSVQSSSGDSIGRVTLKETGTHTGYFEGSIPTAGAQAKAFAVNTEPGRDPNMVISPVKDYPAWRPQAITGKVPEFRVDLNDNVPIAEMTITAEEQGAKLKKFILLTGMNDREMTPVAIYPRDQLTMERPWQPTVTVMNDTDHHHARNDRSVYDLRELEEHLSRGWMTQQYAAGIAENVAGPSEALKPEIPAKVKWLRNNRHHNAHVIYRFRAYFYETEDVTRRFKVKLGKWEPPKVHPSLAHPAQYMLAVDGRPITNKEKPEHLEGEINLRPGLHRFEFWATGWDCRIGFGRSVKVLANLQNADQMVECPGSFFDPETFPRGVLSHRNGPAKVVPNEEGTEFKVTFAPESRTRLLKLVFLDQEGPVPALNKLTLARPDGGTVLPVATDYAELNKNDTLEILVGDKVTVRYVDDRFVTKTKEKHERFLNVSYSTGSVGFAFFEMRKNRRQEMEPYYERLLRFSHGEPVYLTVEDADMDVSVEPDTVEVKIDNGAGKTYTLVATEDGPSTGLFRASFTPVRGTPASKGQVQAPEGATLTATYHDKENTHPGVPTNRYAAIEHAVFGEPILRVSNATVTPIDFNALERPLGMRGLNIGFETRFVRAEREEEETLTLAERIRRATRELVLPRFRIENAYVDINAPPEEGVRVVHGQMMYLEIQAAHLAKRVKSKVSVFVQTESGRKRAAERGIGAMGEEAPPFDINVPGTMRLDAGLVGPGGATDWRETPQIPIYWSGGPMRSDGKHGSQASDELFSCSVPLVADFPRNEGVLSPAEIEERRESGIWRSPQGLVVSTGDKVHIGFRYTDKAGSEKWLTGSARVVSHPVLDVMEDDYRKPRTSAYVGETLNLRVVDLGADVSDEADTVAVLMQAKSGAKYRADLREAHPHSGVFKAGIRLAYSEKGKGADTAGPAEDYDVRRSGFPVVYGDTVGIRYTNSRGQETETHLVTISKGADGNVEPFSKRYDDPVIAMQTQFSLAESYLALARRHRKLGETKQAALEFDRARQLLAKSIDELREPQARAQAEYLLGTLTMEEADVTDDPEIKETRYRAALSRFMNVTGSYPDTISASKAQFQIATVFEELNEPEVAAQEYVKLAYKYPESEHLATAMGKLGTYFLKDATKYEKKAKPLLAKTEDKDAQFEGEAMWRMAVREYVKSARMFSRLQERFPRHELAGKAGLRAGQAYMRAKKTGEALAIFQRLIKDKDYDGVDVRSQAMYWAGLCYEQMRQDMPAYSMYKRLTYDFPESKWASYARGQLSQDKLQAMETDLEIKRLEEGR